VFCFSNARDAQEDYRNIFGCELGTFPVRYLGIHILFRNLKNGEWKPVEDRFERNLASWVG
jgi:hypothetical protein